MKHKYNNLTSVEDIYYMANEMKMPVKCFFTYPELRNYLNKHQPDNINIVYNIINKSNIPGHWISIKIIDRSVYICTHFGVIYRPLQEMFFKLGYYKICWILDQKQKLQSHKCGYFSLLFLATFNPNNLINYNYIMYEKVFHGNDYTMNIHYNLLPDFKIEKYIKYQSLLLDINENND